MAWLRVIIDTNVFVSSLISSGGSSREVIRRCLQGELLPLMGEKLLREYEDVLRRNEVMRRCPLSNSEREELLDALVASAEMVPIFFLWRPNLPDEGDNHVIELAVAGSAERIITRNVRDFRRAELKFDFEIVTPKELIERSD